MRAQVLRSFVPLLVAGLVLIASSVPVLADSGSKQFEYAANGRFDELQQLIESEEAQHPLNTRDRHALCFAYSKTKRYNKLLPCLDKLAENVRKGDLRTRLFGLDDATPAIHIMRADALIELGQYLPAKVEAQKALDWLRKEDSEDLDMVIHSLAALSLASTLGGQRADGERYALELSRINASAFTNADYAGVRAMALGRVYMALGEYQQALDGIRSDSTFKLKTFLDNLVSGALFRGMSNWAWAELPRGFMINKALFATGRHAEAKAGFDELLKIPQVKENGEIYWLILNDRARIAEQEGDAATAIDLFKRAIEIIESQRSTINTEANKIGFVGDKQAVYGRLVAVLFKAGRSMDAYEYIERAKARALVDLLANKEEFAVPPLAPKQAATLLASYRAADNEALAQMPLDMSQATRSGQRNLVVKKGAELNSVAPELASLVSVTSVPLKEILARLSPNEAIVEYYFYGKDLYVVTLSDAGVRVARIDARGLEERIRSFREQIERREEGVILQARALYDTLLRPLEGDIGKRDLLIVPHGALHYLPFAALHDGKDYLVQSRALRYLPSASVLKYLKPVRTRVASAVLVFGNPDLGDPALDLPNAETEARTIAALLPGSELLVRGKASESAFKQFAPSFHYLHIASHGQFNADKALDSRLLLSKDVSQDGSLTVGELYNINLDVDLITLSACETGLGKVLNGDDLVGLTRGFLYAGSSNVVASLWQVDDQATADLMESFYSKLKSGMTKKQALRKAQMDTRARFPHPFFWAAFFLTGQGN